MNKSKTSQRKISFSLTRNQFDVGSPGYKSSGNVVCTISIGGAMDATGSGKPSRRRGAASERIRSRGATLKRKKPHLTFTDRWGAVPLARAFPVFPFPRGKF